MANSVFISYRADNEGSLYKNLLVAWSESSSDHFFDFKFVDTSIGVSINSENADYIKRVIIERIKKSSYILCLIGENTHSSDWVNWELEKAVELGKPLVAVKIKKEYISPLKIQRVGAKWAHSFGYEAIKKAIKEI